MEVKISQDIRKFKTKDIGNFSFAEAGWLVLGIGGAYAVYSLTDKNIEIAILPMAIVLVFGFFKPFGMSFIQFLRTVIKETFLTPLVYISETDFEYNEEEIDQTYGDSVQLSSEWGVIQTPKSVKINKSDKPFIIR